MRVPMGNCPSMQKKRLGTLASTPEFEAPRVDCIRAAESARHCVKHTCCLDEMAECRSMCEDTATVLEALVEMLERPYESQRAVALRRMLEAGLAAVVECSAACAVHGDEIPACASCATDCQQAATSLRQLLREFIDDDVSERSGAT
jgi:hypothetical protein